MMQRTGSAYSRFIWMLQYTYGKGKGAPMFSCIGLLNQFKLAGGSDGFTPVSRPGYRRLADSL